MGRRFVLLAGRELLLLMGRKPALRVESLMGGSGRAGARSRFRPWLGVSPAGGPGAGKRSATAPASRVTISEVQDAIM